MKYGFMLRLFIYLFFYYSFKNFFEHLIQHTGTENFKKILELLTFMTVSLFYSISTK